MLPPTPPNDAPHPDLGGVRLRPISPETRAKLAQYEIDFRFVREVERMERDGRSKNRSWLEGQLQMKGGVISDIRRGKRGVLPVHIALLKQAFNADYKFILYGTALDHEGSAPYLPGRGKLNVFAAYFFPYRTAAGWKVGRRAETHPDYYPDDPQNTRWRPHAEAGRHVGGGGVSSSLAVAETAD